MTLEKRFILNKIENKFNKGKSFTRITHFCQIFFPSLFPPGISLCSKKKQQSFSSFYPEEPENGKNRPPPSFPSITLYIYKKQQLTSE